MARQGAARRRGGRANLKGAGSDLLELRDAEDKTDRIKDVGLATTIQTRDGVELLVEPLNHRALGIRFEAINDYLLDVHPCAPVDATSTLWPATPGSQCRTRMNIPR